MYTAIVIISLIEQKMKKNVFSKNVLFVSSAN